jgi:hypothetical protein
MQKFKKLKRFRTFIFIVIIVFTLHGGLLARYNDLKVLK